MSVPSPTIVVVPSTDPALGKVGVGDGFTLVCGVGVDRQVQLGRSVQDGLRHAPNAQLSPDAQSLLVTQLLLHPLGGVGDGVGQAQLDAPVHSGLRHKPLEQVSPD